PKAIMLLVVGLAAGHTRDQRSPTSSPDLFRLQLVARCSSPEPQCCVLRTERSSRRLDSTTALPRSRSSVLSALSNPRGRPLASQRCGLLLALQTRAIRPHRGFSQSWATLSLVKSLSDSNRT